MLLFFLSFYFDVLLRRKQKRTNPPQAVWKLRGSLKKKKKKKRSEDGLSSSSSSKELYVTVSQAFILWCTFSSTSIKYWRLRSGKKRMQNAAQSCILDGFMLSLDCGSFVPFSFDSFIAASVLLFFFYCQFWFFFFFAVGRVLLNQVMWAGACVHLQRTNRSCTPTLGQLWPCKQLWWERMPSYAKFFIQDLSKPFLICICFIVFFSIFLLFICET